MAGDNRRFDTDRLRTHDVSLAGSRVILRPMREDDWPLIEAINNDPEIAAFTEGGEWQPYTLDWLQQIYRRISEQALMFVIVNEGRDIGECWLQRMNLPRIVEAFPGQDLRRIDLAIGAKHLWGRGLGTETIRLLVDLAYQRERADAVFAIGVGAHNRRSRRAFEKVGFVVLSTVPRPNDPRSDHAYDLILTRAGYERARQSRTNQGPMASGPLTDPMERAP